ncbi:MAG: hypothetical protein H9Q67_07375 [Spiroplasma ixodetis]|nr:hypothetical protein [Spiroplasma ixodetis]
MKDQLPNKIRKNESMIINLDDSIGQGTHWVCLVKKGKIINYFDSFGVKPPTELLNYFALQNQKPKASYLENFNVYYNVDQNHNFNEVICGHLCLDFLTKF